MMVWWCWNVVVVFVVIFTSTLTTGHITQQTDGQHAAVVSQLEQSLLDSFGLRQRPRKARNVVVPPYMLELFKRHQKQREEEEEEEEDEEEEIEDEALPAYSPNTYRSYTHKEGANDHIYPQHKMRLRFNVTTVPISEILKSAELRLTHMQHPEAPKHQKKQPKNTINLNILNNSDAEKINRRRKKISDSAPYLQRVMVYDVMRLATKTTEPILRLLDSRVIDARQSGVQSLDLTDVVQRWVEKPETNHGVLVEVVPFTKKSSLDSSHVRLRRSVEEQDNGLDHQPLLVVHTHDKQVRRTRRSADKHRKGRYACQRHSLHVDFRKVGWDDWIVAPAGYDAYYCEGDCPFPLPDMLNATNHAVVQTLVNSRYPDRVPKACCVPTELSPISMLYMDDDERFVLKNHQNMVVEGCGCR